MFFPFGEKSAARLNGGRLRCLIYLLYRQPLGFAIPKTRNSADYFWFFQVSKSSMVEILVSSVDTVSIFMDSTFKK